MPEVSDHIAISKARTGKEYREVHEWTDHVDFKRERHDINKILEHAAMFAEKYGQEAAQEFVHHIADDVKVRFRKQMSINNEALEDCILYFTSDQSKCPKLTPWASSIAK